MRWHRVRKGLHGLLGVVAWALLPAAVLVGAALKTNPPDWKSWGLDVFLANLQETAWITLPACVILTPLLKWLQSVVGIPWVWEVIRHNLDAFRDHVFEKQDGPVHHHRVTLFKYRFGLLWPPFGGWLVPVERSGHTTRDTRVRFRAPKNKPDDAEGIAGQTWAQRSFLPVQDLQDVSQCQDPEVLEDYAQRTFVTSQWLRKNRELSAAARSFAGIPVEVKGELWGVIVLDSRLERLPGRSPEKTYRLFGRQLGKLLEKG